MLILDQLFLPECLIGLYEIQLFGQFVPAFDLLICPDPVLQHFDVAPLALPLLFPFPACPLLFLLHLSHYLRHYLPLIRLGLVESHPLPQSLPRPPLYKRRQKRIRHFRLPSHRLLTRRRAARLLLLHCHSLVVPVPQPVLKPRLLVARRHRPRSLAVGCGRRPHAQIGQELAPDRHGLAPARR